MIGVKTSNATASFREVVKLSEVGGVAGCVLHPYQRWDCGCSCEQRIRIIIIPQVLQFVVEKNGSVLM
jgi:hypothetical protein